MTQQQNDILERELHIAARPETVFAFFTDPAKMIRWMGQAATLDPRPGGICLINIHGHITRGEYVEVLPHSRLVFTWGWESAGSTPRPGASTVEISLTPDGTGTRLRLRHMGLNAEERANHSLGWGQFLPALVAAAEADSVATGTQ